MSLLQAVVLGLIQGATEFLPVSSSGHLVLVPWALGWHEISVAFGVVTHFGTLLAVVLFLWRDILSLFRGLAILTHPQKENDEWAKMFIWIVLSAIPAALVGFFLEDWFGSMLGAPRVVALLLLVTGTLLWLSESIGKRVRAIEELHLGDALIMGAAQALAILPGISRSGATISAGLLHGLTREAAARVSFLMVLPVITGAMAYEVLKLIRHGVNGTDLGILAVGLVVAFVSGYVAIRFLLGYVQRHSLRGFSVYCWVVGAVAFLATWLG